LGPPHKRHATQRRSRCTSRALSKPNLQTLHRVMDPGGDLRLFRATGMLSDRGMSDSRGARRPKRPLFQATLVQRTGPASTFRSSTRSFTIRSSATPRGRPAAATGRTYVSMTCLYQQQAFKTTTDKMQRADGEPDVADAPGMLEYYCEQAHAK